MKMSGKKAIILGDLHFFIKQSNISFYERTQLPFFKEQLIPYMLENKINTIFQLGDFIDNRSTIDIKLWERMRKEIIEDLFVKNNITVYTLLGNHDISLRESKEISFMQTIADMYDCINLIQEDTIINFNGKKMLFVPWLTKNDKIDMNLVQNSDYVFGHFEIKGFQMTKGHYDEDGLNPNNFSKSNVKQVYSGHYHLKDKKGNIYYVGTPYQLTWNDYNAENGFLVFNAEKDEFIQNNVSSRFVKIKYDDTKPKEIEIKGLGSIINVTEEEFYSNKDIIEVIRNNYIKLFINKSSDTRYEEVIYLLRQENIDFEIINNQEITNLINTDYIANNDFVLDTSKFILDSIKSENTELFKLAAEILNEAKELEIK